MVRVTELGLGLESRVSNYVILVLCPKVGKLR